MYTPYKPQFYYIKMGFKEAKIIKVCFRDGYIGSYSPGSNILWWTETLSREMILPNSFLLE